MILKIDYLDLLWSYFLHRLNSTSCIRKSLQSFLWSVLYNLIQKAYYKDMRKVFQIISIIYCKKKEYLLIFIQQIFAKLRNFGSNFFTYSYTKCLLETYWGREGQQRENQSHSIYESLGVDKLEVFSLWDIARIYILFTLKRKFEGHIKEKLYQRWFARAVTFSLC